ncbi:DUF2569 domain-containing protein [Erwinia endophytica]|uniref:DUF2569 domain-containing protein n=1 Tax=Erwinia endophytica TaxID=1563158 RepID=UPI001265DB6E|nr:DUF2569 domain-containing protein [Erwinia endophytica]KAB8313546.1 DUF2569 domain-containing protein [Erwinia endophytica]
MAVDVKPRITGLLLVPLAWLLMTMLTSALIVAMYLSALMTPELRNVLFNNTSDFTLQWCISLLTSLVAWCYSLWVTWIFCKRSRRLPKHYIVWLLVTVLLAIKTFAFSPISDAAAIRTLLIALLAAAVLAPYFTRSQRVKDTFIEP